MTKTQAKIEPCESNISKSTNPALKSLRVTLTDGAITNGYVHFPMSDSIFNPETYGDRSGKNRGRSIHLVDELGNVYEDDVRVERNTGKLRSRFGSYFKDARIGAKSGDVVEISETATDKYSVRVISSQSSPASSAVPNKTEIKNNSNLNQLKVDVIEATNLILYGPPGTGKTYETAKRAVMLCDGVVPPTREELMVRYETLRSEHRISFITFHQSYGYEEFVEGLRPHVDVTTKQVTYDVMPGAFRRACDAARLRQLVKPGLSGRPLQQRTIYKMSLGASWSDQGIKVFQYGLKNQCVLLGYGEDIDFTDCSDEAAIRMRILEEAPDIKKPDSQVWYVNSFKNELKIGDIIIVSDGNKSFRGIAEVTGEYEFVEDAPFHQIRPVKWLAVFEPSKPVGDIFHRGFSMQTLYKLNAAGLNFENLDVLLSEAAEESPAKPHVFIIDEINRANISKVFGELITLLEPDKREGSLNALTVKLPYSGDDFSVPANLHVIGTMNTADRSIALLDTALRRRFDFEELAPDPSVLSGPQVEGVDLEKLLIGLNERIEVLFDRDHRIGHAFFMNVTSLDDLDQVFRRKVLPLLQEYFYENWSNVRRVLNDYGDGDFITRQSRAALPADGEEIYADEPRIVFGVNQRPFLAAAYLRIYGGT